MNFDDIRPLHEGSNCAPESIVQLSRSDFHHPFPLLPQHSVTPSPLQLHQFGDFIVIWFCDMPMLVHQFVNIVGQLEEVVAVHRLVLSP